MRRLRQTIIIAALCAGSVLATVGTAEAGGPRAAPRGECRAAARIVQAIDHKVPVYSDDLSFAGMPRYVDAYNERLAARQPYPDPAPPAQVRAWLVGEIHNGCRGAVAPGRP